MNRIIKRSYGLILAICLMCLGVLVTNQMEAAAISGTPEDFMKIALLDGVKKCYKAGDSYIKSSGIQLKDFNTFGYSTIFGSKFSDDGMVWVPTMIGNTLTDSELSCRDVFKGWDGPGGGKSQGLNQIYGTGDSLPFYGYMPDTERNTTTVEVATENSAQIRIKFSVKDNDGMNTAQTTSTGELVCNGEYGPYNFLWVHEYDWWIRSCSGSVRLQYSKNDYTYFEVTGGEPVIWIMDAGEYVSPDGARDSVVLSWAVDNFNAQNAITVSEGTSFVDAFLSSNVYRYFKENIRASFNNVYSDPAVTISVEPVSITTIVDGDNVDSYYKFANGEASTAAGVLVHNLLKGASPYYVINETMYSSAGTFDTSSAWWPAGYIFSLYYRYLTNIKEDSRYKDHISFSDCGPDIPSSAYYFKNSETTWCAISIDTEGQGALSEVVTVVDGGSLRKGTIREILEWMKAEDSYAFFKEDDYLDEDPKKLEDGTASSSLIDEDKEKGPDTCWSAGGAQSLGWILCPVLDVVASASNGLYENMVKPALYVEPELFTGRGEGTRNGWDTFRNFANILFVIFLLIVIFSQLTGVGIDNYGIKKILPKMIVVAVLINLSYFICQALVDISNILGDQLREFFTKIPVGEGEGMGLWGGVESVWSTFLVTNLMSAVAAGTIWAVVASEGWVGLLIGLIMIALTALISFLFLFVLLAARKAAIVVLVVLSPLAMICYALPNTKPLFDKYKKLGMNLLLVYPIVGILVGGGNYVSRLLLVVGDSSQFFIMFTAMMAGILPVFFVPTVLKNAMSMMGSLGTKISGFGQTMGRRFTGTLDRGVRGSERYKNYQNRWGERKQEREAQRVQRLYGGRTNLTATQQERLAKANDVMLARDRQREENREKVTGGYFEAARSKNRLEAHESAEDMRLYGDARYVDAQRTKAQNSRTAGMAEATVGVLPLDMAVAVQRATSSRQAQELKNFMEQFSQLTKKQMEDELTSAVSSFSADRNGTNATRLMAALATAESKGMDKEMLNSSGLANLVLRADDATDAQVLNQLAGSKNKVLSQYGKSRGKHHTRGMSLNQFAGAASGSNGDDNLADVFRNKGSEVLVGMDDDTLEYLAGDPGRRDALSTEQLVRAASGTTNQKELTQLNSILGARTNYGGYEMRASDLQGMSLETLNSIHDRSVYDAAATQLGDGSDASKQILANMKQDVREELRNRGYSGI